MINIHRISGYDEPMEILSKLASKFKHNGRCITAHGITLEAIETRKIQRDLRQKSRMYSPPPVISSRGAENWKAWVEMKELENAEGNGRTNTEPQTEGELNYGY